MKKTTTVLLCLVLIPLLLTGCGKTDEENTVRLGALTGPTAMGMAQLLDGTVPGYDPTLAGSADELMPLLLRDQLDIAAIPVNLASTLYNKTEGQLRVIAVNVLGVLYLCELGGETLTSPADLRGQTLYATGKGAMPEVYLRYVLQNGGIDPDKDVNIEWKSEPAEVVALLKNRGSGYALLPQPFATAAGIQLGKDFRAALSLADLWKEAAVDAGAVTACIVARAAFIEEHPELVSTFLENCAASVQWVTENPADAALICEELGIVKAAVAEQAIPLCSLVCLTGSDMRHALAPCLHLLCDFSPAMIGGACPGEDFYYEG